MARGALFEGWFKTRVHTEVVRTPQSNSGLDGVRAGGVSIHSKVSSEVDPLLILLVFVGILAKSQRVRNGG